MKRSAAFLLALLMLAISNRCLRASVNNGGDPQWRSITSDGMTLEFQEDSEDLARQILPQLPGLVAGIEALHDSSIGANYSIAVDKKAECLRFIARKIGQRKPGKHMTEVYDEVLRKQQQAVRQAANIHQFRLYSRAGLVETLQRGEKVRGFAYDAGQNELHLYMEAVRETEIFPLVYSTDNPMDVIQEIQDALRYLGQYYRDVCEPAIVFHEAAEAGIVWDMGINTAFRRWFCDGVAEWVAELATKEFVGPSSYQRLASIYDNYTAPSMKSLADLLAWRGTEYERIMPHTPGVLFSFSHYGFAVQEIRDLAERHGPDAIAKVMKLLSKTTANERNSQAILNAITSVTGEDISVSLREYGSDAIDPFRGVAITGLKFYIVGVGNRASEKPVEYTGTPIRLDGEHDIQVEFTYEVLDLPTTMQISIDTLAGFREVVLVLDQKSFTKVSKCLGLPEYTGSIDQKPYDLRLVLNGELLVQASLSLTKPEIPGKHESSNDKDVPPKH